MQASGFGKADQDREELQVTWAKLPHRKFKGNIEWAMPSQSSLGLSTELSQSGGIVY